MNRAEGEYGRIFERIRDLCAVLRSEAGCPWDRLQTSESLTPYLAEEVHELIEALALGDGDRMTEETGDALYLWCFFLYVLEEERRVSLEEAARGIEEKLTRRHPHVFGDDRSQTGQQVGAIWERQKRQEGAERREPLRRQPAGTSAMHQARRLQEKAAAFGFDWPTPREVLEKIREELGELEQALDHEEGSPAVREELGDLLFSVINLARHLRQDPEATLLSATEKFRRRFNTMTRTLEEAGHVLGETPLEMMEAHWQATKTGER